MLDPVVAFEADWFIHTFWFITWERRDWMAVVYRTGDGMWHSTYRFRYYASPEAWDNRDEISAYHFDADGADDASRDKLVTAFEFWTSVIEKTRAAEVWRVPVMGGPEQALAKLATYPWCHVKLIPATPTRPQ